MYTVNVLVTGDHKYSLRKTCQLSAIPQANDWDLLAANGKVFLPVERVNQDIDNDTIEVQCHADLAHFWIIFSSDTGWEINDPEEFANDPAVKKAAERHEKDMRRIRVEAGLP